MKFHWIAVSSLWDIKGGHKSLTILFAGERLTDAGQGHSAVAKN